MVYYEYKVNLSANQKASISRAYKSRSPVTIRLSYNDLSGNDALHLTKRQINKIEKSKRNGVGTDIKISRTQLRKIGGSFLSSILTIGSKILPKILAPLATGALTSLGMNTIDKTFGKGFRVPFARLNELFPHSNLLNLTKKFV